MPRIQKQEFLIKNALSVCLFVGFNCLLEWFQVNSTGKSNWIWFMNYFWFWYMTNALSNEHKRHFIGKYFAILKSSSSFDKVEINWNSIFIHTHIHSLNHHRMQFTLKLIFSNFFFIYSKKYDPNTRACINLLWQN